jgi:hypothetical protein
MAMPEMDAVKDAALKYDKPTLARLAQSGQLSPTLAVMAGMMRDRIVQSEMKPPSPPTVAEEVMQPMGQRMGLGAIAPGGQPQAPQQPQQAQPQGQGLDQVPVPQEMFERQGMASGGIVAFQAGGGARGGLDPRVAALLQKNPGMTVPQAIKLLSRMGPAATFGVGLAATDALMATDKGVGQAAAMGSGYDYGPEVMTGGRPDIPVESVGTREQGPGFTDYLRAVGLAPKEQVMDPATGKFVDVPSKPIFESATPGLAGVKDQTDVEKRLAEAEAGRGPDVERNSERADVAEARRQDLLKQAAEDQAKKTKDKPSEVKLITEGGAKQVPGTGLSIEDFQKQQKAFGISADPNKDIREQIDKLEQGTKKEREQAKYMALLQAGLGIMGGTSESALENIGKGAMPAVAQYGAALKDIRSEEKEITKMRSQLVSAEDARKRGDFQAYMGAKDKQADLRLKEDKLKIDREMLGVQKAFNEGRLSEAKARNAVLGLRAKQQDRVFKLKAREFFTDNEQSKLEAEFKELYGSNWRKSPNYIRAFENRKEARIREIAAMEADESLVPSADSMLGD